MRISFFSLRTTTIFTYLPSTFGSCKFNHLCMHALYIITLIKALSHCGHGHDLTPVAQLSVVNIADIILEVLLLKHWHQSAFAEMPLMAHRSRAALLV